MGQPVYHARDAAYGRCQEPRSRGHPHGREALWTHGAVRMSPTRSEPARRVSVWWGRPMSKSHRLISWPQKKGEQSPMISIEGAPARRKSRWRGNCAVVAEDLRLEGWGEGTHSSTCCRLSRRQSEAGKRRNLPKPKGGPTWRTMAKADYKQWRRDGVVSTDERVSRLMTKYRKSEVTDSATSFAGSLPIKSRICCRLNHVFVAG